MDKPKSSLRLYLGSGPGYPHQQHLDIMGDWKNWIFVDQYVDKKDIPEEVNFKNIDARFLDGIEPSSVDKIYSSHLLEHFSHTELKEVLSRWYNVLVNGGEIILNVPDMEWACKQIIAYCQGQPFIGYFNQFDGEHGILSVFFGSHFHDGEYHKSGFVKKYLEDLLIESGFTNINVTKSYEAHSMGCLIAKAIK